MILDAKCDKADLNNFMKNNSNEIAWAARRLLQNRSLVLLGMISEHLCQWFISATQDNTPDATNWLKVVAIVQAKSRDGTLAEEST